SAVAERRAKVVGMSARRRNKIYQFSAAASLLLLLSVGTFWFANNNYSNFALADNAFELTSNTKGQNTTILTDFNRAEQAFSKGRYSEVIDIYENIIATNDNPTEVHLAEWNLANTQLAAGDVVNAKLMLERIAGDNTHNYQDDAKALQSDLDSFWRSFTFY
ncbi:MAG: hypothetical protein AAF738_06665, partial [Bacteroidota bacterium]